MASTHSAASNRSAGVWHAIGCRVSAWVADLAANPFTQIGVILFCALWWTVGLPTDILTASLSILAITLTQMVLNRQNEREADDHRRDVAMHAKLDELLIATNAARNEMAGIEELDEEDIQQLKEEVRQSLEQTGATPRHTASRVAETAVKEVARVSKSRNRPTARRTKDTRARLKG